MVLEGNGADVMVPTFDTIVCDDGMLESDGYGATS
jgi:hypothetical protein